jgi:3-isopropylmalate dehydratase small subunit
MANSPADMVKFGGRADMSEDEYLGTKAFAYVRPEFPARVAAGATIVVGGAGFGCGSSREEAVRALKAAGVTAVIAKSFAFIYARNQPNMHLLGVMVSDEAFYELAVEGATVEVDVPTRTATVIAADGARAAFPFVLSTMEERFLQGGGVEKLYKSFRKDLFKALVKGPATVLGGSTAAAGCGDCAPAAGAGSTPADLKW